MESSDDGRCSFVRTPKFDRSDVGAVERGLRIQLWSRTQFYHVLPLVLLVPEIVAFCIRLFFIIQSLLAVLLTGHSSFFALFTLSHSHEQLCFISLIG